VFAPQRAQSADEIGCDDGGNRVHAAVETRHGSGEHTRNHQPGQSGRHFVGDKPREYLVRLVKCDYPVGIHLVENVESRSQKKEEQQRGHRQDRVRPDGPRRLTFGGRGQVPLHDGLVGRVGRKIIGKDGAEHDDEDSFLVQSPIEVNKTEFALFPAGREYLAEAAVQMHDDDHQCCDRAAQQHDHLHDVGPNDRLNTSHHRVKRAQRTHDENARNSTDARRGRQRQRRQQYDHAHPGQLIKYERRTAEQPQAKAVTPLDVLVSRYYLEIANKGKITKNHERRDSHHAKSEQKTDPILLVSNGRYRKIRDRAEHRAKNAQTSSPPRNATAGKKEIVGRLLSPREVAADADHGPQVSNEHGPIQRAEGDARLPRRPLRGRLACHRIVRDTGITKRGRRRFRLRGPGSDSDVRQTAQKHAQSGRQTCGMAELCTYRHCSAFPHPPRSGRRK